MQSFLIFWVREDFIYFVKCCLQQIFNSSCLLIYSTLNVIQIFIYFFKKNFSSLNCCFKNITVCPAVSCLLPTCYSSCQFVVVLLYRLFSEAKFCSKVDHTVGLKLPLLSKLVFQRHFHGLHLKWVQMGSLLILGQSGKRKWESTLTWLWWKCVTVFTVDVLKN